MDDTNNNVVDTSKKDVLLVEDDEFLSSIIKSRLTKSGINVLHARNGEEAISMLEKNKVSLVLLDLILPKMSGFEVMQRIKEDPQIQVAPIIIISNLGQPEDIEKGKSLGAIEYFVKAKISIEDLIKNILGFLEKA